MCVQRRFHCFRRWCLFRMRSRHVQDERRERGVHGLRGRNVVRCGRCSRHKCVHILRRRRRLTRREHDVGRVPIRLCRREHGAAGRVCAVRRWQVQDGQRERGVHRLRRGLLFRDRRGDDGCDVCRLWCERVLGRWRRECGGGMQMQRGLHRP